MNISLSGWIIRIKEDMERVIKTIHDIRYDYKGEIFEELLDSSEEAKKRAFGFMEDMNNIFADLKDLKTDEQKIKWVNQIKEILYVDDLVFAKTERTLINKTEEDDDKKVEDVKEEGDTWQNMKVGDYRREKMTEKKKKELKKEIRFEQKVLAILTLKQAPHDLVCAVEKILSKDVEELSKIKEQK